MEILNQLTLDLESADNYAEWHGFLDGFIANVRRDPVQASIDAGVDQYDHEVVERLERKYGLLPVSDCCDAEQLLSLNSKGWRICGGCGSLC